jgi:hypothetical protein
MEKPSGGKADRPMFRGNRGWIHSELHGRVAGVQLRSTPGHAAGPSEARFAVEGAAADVNPIGAIFLR